MQEWEPGWVELDEDVECGYCGEPAIMDGTLCPECEYEAIRDEAADRRFDTMREEGMR